MLTAIVLTHNSAQHLQRCLTSLVFCDKILIIDDFSTDETVKLAKSFKAKIVNHQLNGDFSTQRNYALSHVDTEWALFIDSDEVVTPELSKEILSSVKNGSHTLYSISRVDKIWGQPLRYGDNNLMSVRLAKKPFPTWSGKVHEVWGRGEGSKKLTNKILHYPHDSLYSYLSKLNLYSSLRAQELEQSGHKAALWEVLAMPILKFIYLYIIKFGILDATAGFISALGMSMYTFLVRGKLYLRFKGVSYND